MRDFEVHPVGTTKFLESIEAVPMTKAEIIMRREEALKMRWPLIHVGAGPLLTGCCF